MEHHERADELDHEAERLEEASSGLKDEIEEAGSEWEARKSDTSVPGATDPEASGPHNLDAEDPATGERKGDEREDERDEALRADAEREAPDDVSQGD